ncbi:polymorphic toxin-type HINT domain-containing protein [Streptomyces sp. OE57]|uniref:polymorphic toxin-type HINT domain-containing protein n=1 Tax=Streptomyces lacaronensis TaxID=3379885 RepID=UPI0039B74638
MRSTQARWVDAGDVITGMRLRTDKGKAVTVTSVRRFAKLQRTYDLTVSRIHTYYVLAGETQVLVHNSNGCVNWASNSVKTWGHAFQWLDNDAAAGS